jgi:hypothetical protein
MAGIYRPPLTFCPGSAPDAMHTLLRQESIRVKRFTLVFNHIHLAPNQEFSQNPATPLHPSETTAPPLTHATEPLQLLYPTKAMHEAQDSNKEMVSMWISEDGPTVSSLGNFLFPNFAKISLWSCATTVQPKASMQTIHEKRILDVVTQHTTAYVVCKSLT